MHNYPVLRSTPAIGYRGALKEYTFTEDKLIILIKLKIEPMETC
jgi:hypothetical protein